MLSPPENPSGLRKALLAPLSLAYAGGSLLHRRFGMRSETGNAAGRTPLIGIGSLRAGGAGKTAAVLELARQATARGLRTGVLAYRLHGNDREEPLEVFPGTDWRLCSDEAVLLARESSARVFATRNRDRAWSALSRSGGFDVLISDDGFADIRLKGGWWAVLSGPGERPGILDLLPGGRYRLTAAALQRADCVATIEREPLLPADFDPRKTYWLLCGLANPSAFRRSLEGAGVRVAGLTAGPDHGLPDLRAARRDAARSGADGFLCSAKDWVKLSNRFGPGESAACVAERVALPRALIGRLDACSGARPSW